MTSESLPCADGDYEIIECENPNCGTPIKIIKKTGDERIFCRYGCLTEYIEMGNQER